MAQTNITNYFGVRTQKRKFEPNGELVRKKILILNQNGEITPEKVISPRVKPDSQCELRKRSKAVTRLNFEHAPPSVKLASKQDDTKPSKKIGENEPKSVDGDLSLKKVRRIISNSSRLDDLKSRLSSFNEKYNKLKDLQKPAENKAETEIVPVENKSKSSLKQFESIEVDVPASPVKGSPVKSNIFSPVKQNSTSLSPFKSPSKIPAYVRYASLTSSSSALVLPHHYRFLAEVFRALETSCSILHNRRELITFAKLKPTAQEMLKRNVTEKHLAQIKFLSPQMYTFTREKVKTHTYGSKRDEYELVVTPKLISCTSGSPIDILTPEVMLERRRSFYNLLIEKVKQHHESFLLSLDPPLQISNSEIKRWHPEFDLERIPDVESDSLPEIPNAEKYLTPEHMLLKAKEMFSTKIQKAMKELAENKLKLKNGLDNKKLGNVLFENETTASTSSLPEVELINPILKNIPDVLLQKVKAKQAEKALKAMTSSENDDIVVYQKLPELARILRNLFLVEKKSILPIEILISKLDNSFCVKCSNKEIKHCLKILSKEVPEWLSFQTVRNIDFIKLVKVADFTKIMSKLETLVTKNA